MKKPIAIALAAAPVLLWLVMRYADMEDRAWMRPWEARVESAASALPKSESGGARPDILLIVMDTTRADAVIDAAGRPLPEGWARRPARVFTRAYSTSCWTVPSHASLLTGLEPPAHRATQLDPKLREGFPTLAERLSAAGYRSAGFVENPYIGWNAGFGRGFDAYFDVFRGLSSLTLRELKGWAAFLGVSRLKTTMTPDLAERWLDGTREAGPRFVFVNLLDAHRPYIPLPVNFHGPLWRYPWEVVHQYRYDLRRWYVGNADRSPEAVSRLRAMYLDEVDETAEKARRVVDAFLRSGRPALVIVTSDHGENFGEDGHYDHVFTLRESVVRVPLLMMGEGVELAVEAEPVNLIDVHNTILAAAGVAVAGDLRREAPLPRPLHLTYADPVETLSLFSEEQKADPRLRDLAVPRAAVVEGDRKITLDGHGRYTFASIRGFEESPIEADASDAPWSALKAEVDAVMEAVLALEKGDDAKDAQTRDALRSLGYLQ